MAIHLDGAFLLTKACVKYMYAQQSGALIYMGSVHSHEASPLKSAYVTAKQGLLGLALTMAKEGGKHGVRANIICPGFVRTPLVDKQIPEQAKALGISEERVVNEIMLGETVDKQFTRVEDVAEVALMLAAFPTNALTGESIPVMAGIWSKRANCFQRSRNWVWLTETSGMRELSTGRLASAGDFYRANVQRWAEGHPGGAQHPRRQRFRGARSGSILVFATPISSPRQTELKLEPPSLPA